MLRNWPTRRLNLGMVLPLTSDWTPGMQTPTQAPPHPGPALRVSAQTEDPQGSWVQRGGRQEQGCAATEATLSLLSKKWTLRAALGPTAALTSAGPGHLQVGPLPALAAVGCDPLPENSLRVILLEAPSWTWLRVWGAGAEGGDSAWLTNGPAGGSSPAANPGSP